MNDRRRDEDGTVPEHEKSDADLERDDLEHDDWDDDDWDDEPSSSSTDTRLIAVVVVAAVAIIAVILLTRGDGGADRPEASDTPPESVTEEENRDWPWDLGGQGESISEDGLHLWSDLDGIHLRAVGDTPITVVFTADDPVSVKDAGTGVTASTDEGEEITFELPAGSDGSDGPDLDVSGWVGRFSVEATTPDGPLELDRFHVGDSAQARSNPATFERGG